mgnify:FL=1
MSGRRYDVVVSGAGMIGLALAKALAPSGLRIAVLDPKPIERWRGGEWALRVSALTVVTERILRALGAWEAMSAARVSPLRAIQVWDGVARGSVHFDSAAIGEPHLGHIVENNLTQTALYDALLKHDNVTPIIPGTLTGFETSDEKIELALEDGRRLEAALLVGADGAASTVRRLCGIDVRRGDYGQMGLVCTIRTEQPHGEVARQRFLPSGPLAFLPLNDGRCSIVWSQPVAEAQRRLALSEEAFCRELTEASDHMLGQVLGCGERGAFPLRKLHAVRYTAPRVALIGDAAHVIHPLAGQGANLGFADAAVLAEEILRAVERGRDPGGQGALRRYERRRRGENQLMQSTMDGFHYLFRSASPWIALPRSLGLDLTDRLPPAKAFFMYRAMGFGGDLPRLAR